MYHPSTDIRDPQNLLPTSYLQKESRIINFYYESNREYLCFSFEKSASKIFMNVFETCFVYSKQVCRNMVSAICFKKSTEKQMLLFCKIFIFVIIFYKFTEQTTKKCYTETLQLYHRFRVQVHNHAHACAPNNILTHIHLQLSYSLAVHIVLRLRYLLTPTMLSHARFKILNQLYFSKSDKPFKLFLFKYLSLKIEQSCNHNFILTSLLFVQENP